jgi:3,5-epimerase/4-reductase
MTHILIFGAGYLGTKCSEVLPDAVLSTALIDDPEQVCEAIEENKPDCVLNCAGLTGSPNVDWCETNQLPTYRSNTIGPLVLAEECSKANVHLTHLGSGCVYYGASPDPKGWKEDDYANPSATYTRSKYAADLLLEMLPNVAIVRLRMPIDATPSPRNLITKLANYPKIINVENSVTVVEDLIQVLGQVMEKRATGIFHAVNPGTLRHRDLIKLYEELVDPSHTNEWINEEDLMKQGLVARKRSNNILQNNRLPAIGIHMRPLDVALRDAMEKYAAAWKAKKTA